LLTLERRFWGEGSLLLAGVDEAGRGPLAGPVVAAAVILEREWAEAELDGSLRGLTDSKKLSAERREAFCSLLSGCVHVHIGVGSADVAEIDELNILRATHLAMARALALLPVMPDLVLVDGLPVKGLPCRSEAFVGGDSLSLSIAAASVVAKVTRDARMLELDAVYPQYGFARHKGYGSSEHMQALFRHGPCPEHRMSFTPVRQADELRRRAAGGEGPRLLPL